MAHLRPALLASLLTAGLAAPALADPAYPRLVGGALDNRVEYEPGAPATNIVGGGRVTVVETDGDRPVLVHADAAYAQRPLVGRVPVITGGEDGRSVVYVTPAPSAPPQRAARATAPRG